MTKWRDSYKQEPDDALEGNAGRVLRGGAWWYDADAVRCVSRLSHHPRNGGGGGFRCVQ